MTQTVVGLYHDLSTAQRVVEALVDIGITRENISLVANDATGEYGRSIQTSTGEVTTGDTPIGTGVGLGAALGGLGGLLLGLGALAIPGIGPVLAAGPLVSTLIGAGIGAVTGGLIGALVDIGIPETEAQYYAEGVRRGGNLVTVNAPDHRVDDVRSVMDRFNPIDIDERVAEWQRSGWKGFDESQSVYTTDEVNREHSTYQTTTPRVSIPEEVVVPGERRTDFVGTSTASDRDMDDFDTYATDFRRHHDTYFVNTDFVYDQYLPAYRYGYDLAHNEMYRGRPWNAIEPQAREYWMDEYADNPWEDFKEAVRYAWERVKEAVDLDDDVYPTTTSPTDRPPANP